MATITDIENNVRDWVAFVLPARAFQFEDEGLPTPAIPWVTAKVTAINPLQHDIGDMIDDPDNSDNSIERHRGLSTIDIKIGVWDNNDNTGSAMDDAKRLRTSLSAGFATYQVYQNMGRGPVTNIIDLDAESDGRRQARAEFTLTGYAALTEDFPIDYFNQIDIDGVTIGVNDPPPSRPVAK